MNNFRKLKIFFSLSWKVSPSYIIFLIINTFVNSSKILINVILPKYLIDELTGNRDIETLIFIWIIDSIIKSFIYIFGQYFKEDNGC